MFKPWHATVYQPRHVPKAQDKISPDQLIEAEFRTLATAQEKTAGNVAAQARAITEQTGEISRQASEIEHLQHDTTVLTICIVALICVVLGRLMISALFKRKSAKPHAANPSTDDIVGAFLRSTHSRS